jgi:hypothetical protein
MRWIWLIVGVVVTIVGLLWTLQGLDVVGGSAMSGKTIFAVIGPIVGVVGIILIVVGLRRGRPRLS